MSLHFRIRSVLLHGQGSAVTLEPVEWGRWVDSEGEAIDPASSKVYTSEEHDDLDWVACSPATKWAEPFEGDGKLTELRFSEQVPWKPGEYVTFPDPTVFLWHGVNHGINERTS